MTATGAAGLSTRETVADGRLVLEWRSVIARKWSLLLTAGFTLTLLARNTSLFRLRIVENGDAAANSLLVRDAERFDLLVGNYSRFGFNHPGPALMDVQAIGETVFFRWLHLVPTPYNGQALAVLLMNAVLVASALLVLWTWHQSRIALTFTFAIVTIFYENHANSIASTWPPYMYVAPFLLFLISAASVASGRTRHLPFLAFSAGLLVHGHVAFVIFVGVIVPITLVAHLRWSRDSEQNVRRYWAAFVSIALLFALPIVLHTVLSWPGEIGKYLAYNGTGARPRVSADALVAYLASFWTTDHEWQALLPFTVVSLAAGFGATARSSTRRFFLTACAMGALAQFLFAVYVIRGVDDLSYKYVGYFMWDVPLLFMLVLGIGFITMVQVRHPRIVVSALCAFCVATLGIALGGSGLDLTSGYRGDPTIGTAAKLIASKYPGNGEVVLHFHGPAAWVDVSGVLLLLERSKVPTCVTGAQGAQATAITRRRVCGSDELHSEVARVEFLEKESAGPVDLELTQSRMVFLNEAVSANALPHPTTNGAHG